MVFKTTRFTKRREIKSRRDGILLTAGFNLRTRNAAHTTQSPVGTTQLIIENEELKMENDFQFSIFNFQFPVVSSLRDLVQNCLLCFRRLKPTVNRMLSLRDLRGNVFSETNSDMVRLRNMIYNL